MQNKVAIIADNSVEYIHEMIKEWNQDNCVILIDVRQNLTEIEKILEENHCDRIITDSVLIRDYFENSKIIQIINQNKYLTEIYYENKEACFALRKDKTLAIILYSSGTTGQRKGIMLSHYSITNNAMHIIEMKDMHRENVQYTYKPFSHSATLVGELLTSLICGNKLIISSTNIMLNVHLRNIEKYGVSYFSINPSVAAMLVKTNITRNYNYSTLKKVVCCGAKLSVSMIKEMQTIFGAQVINAYGLTELGPMVAFTKIDQEYIINEKYRETASVGQVLKDVQVRIALENGSEADTNEVGEVYVATPMIMNGYVNRKFNLVDGYYQTGDMGYFDKNNNLYIVGRKDRMFIISGHNIFPEAVENIIYQSGIVAECLIRAEHADNGEVISCDYIPCNTNVEDSEMRNLLRIFCKKNLATYEIPKKFNMVDKMQYTLSGKVKFN